MNRSSQAFATGLAIVVIGGASLWLVSRANHEQLLSSQRVRDEIGLVLPVGARITAADSDTWSLVDGDNYEWLIESDTSILPWAKQNMRPETGGWEHIRNLSQLGPFEEKIPSNQKFGGVWRGVGSNRDGGEETSYLYISGDGKVA